MTVTVTNKDFKYAVSFLKKKGYKFDSSSKTWSGDKDISFLADGGYVRPVQKSEFDLYEDMMENPNSIN